MFLGQLEKYCVDITCIQEMRWMGSGTIEKKNWIIFYNCDNKQQVGNRIYNPQEGETSYSELPT